MKDAAFKASDVNHYSKRENESESNIILFWIIKYKCWHDEIISFSFSSSVWLIPSGTLIIFQISFSLV